MFKIKKHNQGFSLVEVIVALGVFAILAAGVFNVVTSSYRNFYGTGDKQLIAEFAQEGMEAARSIRNNSWQDLETVSGAGDKGLTASNGYWEFSGTSDTLGDLTRVVVVTDAQRDGNWEIVTSGGTDDPNTKKVVVTVSGSGIDDYVLTTYFTNWSYETWNQTNWSGIGDREFWADATMASSSYSNISTSTVGAVLLASESYSAGKTITIDNSKVSGSSNLTNFPILISSTLDTLKTTTNGGSVTDDNGYDIIFTSDLAGTVQLDHEIESYASTTGEIVMWVEIPTLDYNDDTVIYMYYGNNTISTSQESATGVWDSNYVAVLHMAEDPSIYTDGDCAGPGIYTQVCDSTGNNNAYAGGMESGDLITGKTGYAYDFDGVSEFLLMIDSASLDDATGAGQARTWSFWLNITNAVDNKIITEKSSFDGDHFWLQTQGTAGDIIGGVSAGGSYLDSNPAPGEGTWKYITVDYDGTDGNLYVDGVLNNGPVTMTAPADGNNHFLVAGGIAGSYVDADFDELRISKISRGTDWLTTEYNNMSAPETFYYIGNTAYAYRQSIVVDNTKVSGSEDLTNYPLLVSTSSDSFKFFDFGGHVRNANGYDIVFTSDQAGVTQLDHEIESYSSTTGEIVMWVEIPTLSYSADTTIYMQYGSSTISSSEENVAGVWDDGYAMVYHLGEPVGTTGAGSVTDSTGNTSGTPTSGLVYESTGKAGTGIDFSSGTGISAGSIGDPILTASTTISFWANVSDIATPGRQNPFDQAYGGWGTMTLETSGRLSWYFGNNGGNGASYANHYANSMVVNSTWVYATAVRSPLGLAYTWYKNGAYNSGSTYGGTFPVIATRTFTIGDGYVNPFNGVIDEFRVTNDVRSADWIATEYANMNAPETFFSMGGEVDVAGDGVVLGTYNSPGQLYSSIFDLGANDKELKSVTVDQNIPSGCDLDVTVEVSNDNTFAAGVSSEVFSDASVANYTSSTPVSLNGKQYMRYKVDLTSCTSGSDTPTLYLVNFNYR
jgi:prepilin-type N-terminal cleavage/methylation domain-containing protein